ncbi:hypothetical protein [Nocardia crassostreae]|uniref:hypothetical protein n=1 Tax=Nocardia crassostreae TaxID=53428 RepID=UPI00082C4636|nr:hypothetical protein [Nocardia crassostreae]
MPTPAEVRAWDVSGLSKTGDAATTIADAILKASDSQYTAIHDGLDWQGEAGTAADAKAERERTQMRAIVTAYDDLGATCVGAFNAMEHPLAEIKTIFQLYVTPPVAVSDDWTITGVEDWNSEQGLELQRLSGLLSTLLTADATWGAKITEAVGELHRMAPPEALTAITAEIQKIKKQDPDAVPDEIATHPTFSWAPDIPSTTASTIIGTMTEVQRMGLQQAATEAGDSGVLKWVQNWGERGKWTSGMSRFGVLGNIVGTVPAIVNDIEDDGNVTKAIVSESAGTAAGMVAGGVMGSLATSAVTGMAIGSVVPGVGTAAGLVVGTVVGGLVSWGGSKAIQKLWS